MKILITGAGGFIGTHLRDALCAHYDLLCPTEPQMDLRSSFNVNSYINFHKPDVVIHLAAKTEVALSFDDYEDFNRVNYLGTVLLAEANRRLNPNLRQFIFSSTMETYGHQPFRTAFKETTQQFPAAPYAVAKLACEKYLAYLKYAYKFPATIFRQTNAYGRTNTDFFVVERILTQMMDGDVVKLGDPAPMRNFLFIDDLIDLYIAALGNDQALGETFVTGPDNVLSIYDLMRECQLILNWKGRVEWNTRAVRPGEIYYLNSDPAKAEALLGWKPGTALRDGLVATIQRIRQARAGRAAA